jgi:hypothetical protein
MRTHHSPATAATTRTHDNMITSPQRINSDTPTDLSSTAGNSAHDQPSSPDQVSSSRPPDRLPTPVT